MVFLFYLALTKKLMHERQKKMQSKLYIQH